MDIKAIVKDVETGAEHEESYEGVDTDDAQKYMEGVIQNWNDTLRPHDKARKLVSVRVVGDTVNFPHKWGKVNLVTIMVGTVPHDKYKCENCGITGKRYSLGGNVIRDPKHRSSKNDFCQGVK